MSQESSDKQNPFEGWTTIEEASELVGRRNTTVRTWVTKGYITSYAIGRKVRVVNLDELRAYEIKRSRKHRY